MTHKAVITQVSIGLIFIAISIVTIWIIERRCNLLDKQFIFFPDRKLERNPEDINMEYEDVVFTTSDGVNLHGWFVPFPSNTTFLWFHGNAGNISHRLDNLSLLRHHLNVNIFIFDYRGYGESQGTPSEKGLYLDAEAALGQVKLRQGDTSDQHLVLFGRSLGSSIAVEIATRHEVHAVILESGFTSVRDMAKKAYPFLPSDLLVLPIKSKFDSLSKIGNINSPVMVIHGDNDTIVPYDMGKRLYDSAKFPKRFYSIVNGNHNDTHIVGGLEYFYELKKFIENPTGD